tara:strand:+ start:159 stop:344 length:186 start_codon:yes stop_codon:yes gene_type:complete
MKYTKKVNRDNIGYTFYTGNKNQFLNFTKEDKVIEADTYTRKWIWNNKDKYEEILYQILND